MDMPQDYDDMAPSQGADDAGVKFCIRKSPDGSLTYYTERNGQAEQEMPANDIGQALKMALDAFREADGGAEKGGFDSVNDPLARGPMPPRKPKYGGPEQ